MREAGPIRRRRKRVELESRPPSAERDDRSLGLLKAILKTRRSEESSE